MTIDLDELETLFERYLLGLSRFPDKGVEAFPGLIRMARELPEREFDAKIWCQNWHEVQRERDDLLANAERHQQASSDMARDWKAAEAERDKLRAEVERLKSEIWQEFKKWNPDRSPDVVAALSRLIAGGRAGSAAK